MTDRAQTQAANVVPPRRGLVWAQAVDVTARPYNIALLPFGGKAICNANQVDHIYLTLQADGGDVYYYFDSATGSALLDTTTNAAGTPLTATTMSAAMAAKVPSGSSVDVRIERNLDSWICVKTSASTATLRVYASSGPEV